jgi:hypothetical protein
MSTAQLQRSGPYQAKVICLRSFDSGVFMELVDPKLHGWTFLDDRGHAVAVAAQAAGRPIWMKYQSYDPNWPEGTLSEGDGFFDGVTLALSNDAPGF